MADKEENKVEEVETKEVETETTEPQVEVDNVAKLEEQLSILQDYKVKYESLASKIDGLIEKGAVITDNGVGTTGNVEVEPNPEIIEEESEPDLPKEDLDPENMDLEV